MSQQFPNNFVWGTATASYQIEGAVREGGRAPSIWDAMCEVPGKVHNGDTGEVACDHYHRFEEDVKLMKELGLRAYRFSIAWPRIQADGSGDPNPEGVDFYNRLIDCLIAHDIEPWVTLYHWDLPLALETEHGGWLDRGIVDRFGEYAEICFGAFGDRVKHWITLNEPWCSSVLGYGMGVHAPGREDADDPYLAAHHMILAHGRAVEIYRGKYAGQEGEIGITNNCDFRYAETDSEADRGAAQRSMEFFLAWFADPIWKGDYPAVMKERLGDRLPSFSEEERAMVLGSSDFFGLNHYSTMLAAEPGEDGEMGSAVAGNGGMVEDQMVRLSSDPAWKKTHMDWNIVPEGCGDMLKWIDDRYDRPAIYLTENGCAIDEPDHDTGVNDVARKDYFEGYLRECRKAIEAGVDLRGYFAWSFLDNFEWAWGYSRRFGICRVDFETQERTPKLSARWYGEVIASQGAIIGTGQPGRQSGGSGFDGE